MSDLALRIQGLTIGLLIVALGYMVILMFLMVWIAQVAAKVERLAKADDDAAKGRVANGTE